MAEPDLDYNFQESGVLRGDKRNDPDAGNISILKQILQDLTQLKAQYQSVNKLDLNDKSFSVEQQLSNNKWIVNQIGDLELRISEKLKELGDGR